MGLDIKERARLPSLSWAATLVRGESLAEVVCGSGIEVDDDGLIAGAWSGDFGSRTVHRSPTFSGTAVRNDKDGIIFVCGNTSPTSLFVLRCGERLVVSNALALALAVGKSGLDESYPFYPQDLYLAVPGRMRHGLSVPATGGTLTVVYQSFRIDPDLELMRIAPVEVPAFSDFRSYRSLLKEQMAATFSNAADPRRRIRYSPIASISKGYDSPATTVLAHELGCREAFTLRQSIRGEDDDGAAIACQLGMEVHSFDTYAYKRRTDLPEVEFIAASYAGGQVYMAGMDALLSQRLIVTGFGGDVVWSPRYSSGEVPRFPIYLGGYSSNDFCLRLPAIEFAVPAIGALRATELAALSRAPEMAPWSVGGDYDRPVPRRIVEEAGIARDAFAGTKRMVTPPHDSVTRRAPALESYLSPHSVAEFSRWYERRRPLNRWSAALHRLATDTVGRVLWSRKTARALRRLRFSWPPDPVRLVHLRFPMRKNAFLFQWAVERQIERYGGALSE